MKILDKIQEIFNQYDLKPIELPKNSKDVYIFLKKYPEFSKDFKSTIDDSDLNTKYRKYIPNGWYGFDIGTPIVPIWVEIVDKVIEECVAVDPNFEIHQVKLKFGGIRFYVHSDVIEDLFEAELFVEKKLFDRALIY